MTKTIFKIMLFTFCALSLQRTIKTTSCHRKYSVIKK